MPGADGHGEIECPKNMGCKTRKENYVAPPHSKTIGLTRAANEGTQHVADGIVLDDSTAPATTRASNESADDAAASAVNNSTATTTATAEASNKTNDDDVGGFVTDSTATATTAELLSNKSTDDTSDSSPAPTINDGTSSVKTASRKRIRSTNQDRPDSSPPVTSVVKQPLRKSTDDPDATPEEQQATAEKPPGTIPNPHCQIHETELCHLHSEKARKGIKHCCEKGRHLALAKCRRCDRGTDYLVTCSIIGGTKYLLCATNVMKCLICCQNQNKGGVGGG